MHESNDFSIDSCEVDASKIFLRSDIISDANGMRRAVDVSLKASLFASNNDTD